MLSLKNDEMISSTCSAHEAPPSSELLNTHLTGCELDMITYPYKNVPSSFPHDYDYGLSESHLGKFNQEHISSALVGKIPVEFPFDFFLFYFKVFVIPS